MERDRPYHCGERGVPLLMVTRNVLCGHPLIASFCGCVNDQDLVLVRQGDHNPAWLAHSPTHCGDKVVLGVSTPETTVGLTRWRLRA